MKFKHVPNEVISLIDTGIFWMAATHLTNDLAREGIERSRKLLSPSAAVGYDIVPMSGEMFFWQGAPLWTAHFFRYYHVSLSTYPPHGQSWRDYLSLRSVPWTPELSRKIIQDCRDGIKRIREQPPNYLDFDKPEYRRKIILEIEEAIRFEQRRQGKYAKMDETQRQALAHPKKEIYGLSERILKVAEYYNPFLGYRAEHPFVPSHITLGKFITGMFTVSDISSTREWISRVIGRDVPVGSIDALATWEETYHHIPAYKEAETDQGFYFRIFRDDDYRTRVVEEVKSKLKK
jgi:hypothetical protein